MSSSAADVLMAPSKTVPSCRNPPPTNPPKVCWHSSDLFSLTLAAPCHAGRHAVVKGCIHPLSLFPEVNENCLSLSLSLRLQREHRTTSLFFLCNFFINRLCHFAEIQNSGERTPAKGRSGPAVDFSRRNEERWRARLSGVRERGCWPHRH